MELKDGVMLLLVWVVTPVFLWALFTGSDLAFKLLFFSPIIIAGAASLYVFVLAPIFGAMSDAPAKRRDPGVPGKPQG